MFGREKVVTPPKFSSFPPSPPFAPDANFFSRRGELEIPLRTKRKRADAKLGAGREPQPEFSHVLLQTARERSLHFCAQWSEEQTRQDRSRRRGGGAPDEGGRPADRDESFFVRKSESRAVFPRAAVGCSGRN